MTTNQLIKTPLVLFRNISSSSLASCIPSGMCLMASIAFFVTQVPLNSPLFIAAEWHRLSTANMMMTANKHVRVLVIGE